MPQKLPLPSNTHLQAPLISSNTMKAYTLTFILTLTSFTPISTTTNRRLLHQPLFPVTSTPSPPLDNPFFHLHTPDQPPPPPPPSPDNTTATHPLAPPPPPPKKPVMKITALVSVGIVTLIMLWALVFFIYKHKLKRETQDSPTTGFESGTVTLNRSPYNRLKNSVKRSDRYRYRPSPELQPLPPLSKSHPLSKPMPQAVAMTSDDDDEEVVHEFYSPHGSLASIENGSSVTSLNAVRISKRDSPRSIFSDSFSPVKQPPESPGAFSIKTASTSCSK
ncbi:hypothetical protein QVD17_18728 [Tagetes erecta]|uniref:Uncharacterized protein n=1 Tax=Tagetes erecta TaxID=13708 RepID=A0AAD8KI93_TARER|nr:hypothetical protein QVD17_18728 [Tagetes erecta]